MDIVVDLQYFPPVTLFKKIAACSNIIFEQYEQFDKMSYRNRAVVAGANGLVNLSIPLERGRNQKTLMKDIRISNRENWQSRHWKTILSCYNRSPWLEFYQVGLEELYRQKMEFLWDWNLTCFEWVKQELGLPIGVKITEAYQPFYEATAYVDWRGKLLPKNRLEPGQYPVYSQVFEERIGFLPNLSVLDLLFCQGKGAMKILQRA